MARKDFHHAKMVIILISLLLCAGENQEIRDTNLPSDTNTLDRNHNVSTKCIDCGKISTTKKNETGSNVCKNKNFAIDCNIFCDPYTNCSAHGRCRGADGSCM